MNRLRRDLLEGLRLYGLRSSVCAESLGGGRRRSLNPEPADDLPVNAQRAGFADYTIFTGIDPFALSATDVVLFNVSMNTLNNGAEEVFLSGMGRSQL